MNSPRHFQLMGTVLCTGIQGPRQVGPATFNTWLSSLPRKPTPSHWKGREAHTSFYGLDLEDHFPLLVKPNHRSTSNCRRDWAMSPGRRGNECSADWQCRMASIPKGQRWGVWSRAAGGKAKLLLECRQEAALSLDCPAQHGAGYQPAAGVEMVLVVRVF